MDRREYYALRHAIRAARREDTTEATRMPVLAATWLQRLQQPSREQRLLALVPERVRPAMQRREPDPPVTPLAGIRLQQYHARRHRSAVLGRGIAEYRRHFPIAA